MIRKCLNGETQYNEVVLFWLAKMLTRRTETSKYPEEEKTIVIPLVAASETGLAQTDNVPALSGL